MAAGGRAGRAAATYVLLAGIQRGISFLILPFLTHAMSVPDYGAASMLSATALLLTAIIAAPLVQLIIRAAARGDDDGPALLRVAGIYCYVLLPLAVLVMAGVVALTVSDFLGVEGHLWAIELVAIGLQPATSTFALWVAQAREDLSSFVLLSSTSIVTTAVFKLLFVVAWDMGVLGWVLADVISATIAAILAFFLIRVPRATVDRAHLRRAVTFTLPLLPHSASLWALNSMSRPVMAAVSDLEQVGILSFGLNLAQFAGLVLAESNRAFLPSYARETLPAPSKETRGPVQWQLVLACIVPAAVGWGLASVGHQLFAEAFWPSFGITAVLLIGQAALGLYLIPMNYMTQTAGLTRYSALASGAGAATILILTLLWGSAFGAVGVAYATTAGYIAMAVMAFALTSIQKLDIRWRAWLPNWTEILLGSVALALTTAILVSTLSITLSWMLIGISGTLIIAAVGVLVRRRLS